MPNTKAITRIRFCQPLPSLGNVRFSLMTGDCQMRWTGLQAYLLLHCHRDCHTSKRQVIVTQLVVTCLKKNQVISLVRIAQHHLDRQLAEQQCRELQNQYQLLQGILLDALFMMTFTDDYFGKILMVPYYSNAKFVFLLNYLRGGLIDQTCPHSYMIINHNYNDYRPFQHTRTFPMQHVRYIYESQFVLAEYTFSL